MSFLQILCGQAEMKPNRPDGGARGIARVDGIYLLGTRNVNSSIIVLRYLGLDQLALVHTDRLARNPNVAALRSSTGRQ